MSPLAAKMAVTPGTASYQLSGAAPWLVKTDKQVDLSGPWDTLSTFVLGNDSYLMGYCRADGRFNFFKVAPDFAVSEPYVFQQFRNTPTKDFTAVASFSSLNQQYFLGYDVDTGHVAAFSLMVTPSTSDGSLPLLAQNVWDHHWAKGWTHFAFFQLGKSNFFFKINRDKLNVNIDHIQDNPALGTVEIGSYLQKLLPDAMEIDVSTTIPWANGEPYLLTYIASSGTTALYRIHADCLGWTSMASAVTVEGASQVIPYRIGDTSYCLYYLK